MIFMQREAYFDHAKILFIFLVVFGHMIQPLKQDIVLVDNLYQWIYLFHMPAFVMISGFFAKGSGDKGYIMKLAKRLIVPYLIFQAFYTIYYRFIGKSNWESSFFDPHWGLWFLLSLFSWHLLLIAFKKLPPLYGVLIAFTLGIGIGYISGIGEAFSLSRTIVFFPFFLLGYWATKDRLMQLKNVRFKLASLAVLLVIFAVISFTPTMSAYWLFGSTPYQALDYPITGGLIRVGLYALAVIMTFSILAWVPRQEMRFTYMGQYTLYVYLLHGTVIQYIRQADLLKLNNNFDVIGLAVISILLVGFLSSKWIVMFTQPAIELKNSEWKKWIQDSNGKSRKEKHALR